MFSIILTIEIIHQVIQNTTKNDDIEDSPDGDNLPELESVNKLTNDSNESEDNNNEQSSLRNDDRQKVVKVNDLLAGIQKLLKDKEEAVEALDQLSLQMSELEHGKAKFIEELATVTSELNEAKLYNEELKQSELKLQSFVDSMKSEKDIYLSKLKTVQHRRGRELDSFVDEVEHLRISNRELLKKSQTLDTENIKLTEECNTQRKTVKQLKIETQKRMSNFNKLVKEFGVTKSELEKVKSVLLTTEEDKFLLDAKVKELTSEIEDLTSSVTELEDTKTNHLSCIESTKEQLAMATNENLEFERNVTKLKTELEELMASNQQLNDENNNLKEENRRLASDVESNSKDLLKEQNDNKNAQDRITNLTVENETLQQDKFSLISRIGKQEKEKEAAVAEITKLKETIDSKGAEHKAALDREGTLTDKLELMIEEKKSMSSNIDEKEGLIKENNKKLELLNSDFATLKSDHEKVNFLQFLIDTCRHYIANI